MTLTIKVTNVTATFSLSCKINLSILANCISNVEYAPKRKNSATYRNVDPRFTALIHTSGNVILVGVKSEKDVRMAATAIVQKLKENSFPVSLHRLRFSNIAAAGNLNFRLNLPTFYERTNLKINADFNPELFPGMICTFPGTNCKATFFTTGKFIITGSKSILDLTSNLKNIENDIELMNPNSHENIMAELEGYILKAM
ncbi:TATA-box-binding protein-like protein [Leptotrombidium deliense]|uniref:TATA-box-binding protein-like protein n=1 Tax=Leptotrombidium deliense TaxID=299467 RepID=A0A443S216_9ACAR|nr:TATA-box-binding protein-like protein [Leptotrombidium deliense]